MLKLGCTLPNLANICLHKTTDSNCTLLLKVTRTCWRRFVKIWLVVRLLSSHASLWLTKLFFRKSTTLCKSIVGIDASQLYLYSMCQPMPTGLYSRWNYDSASQKIMPRQNKTLSFENMLLSYFQQTRPERIIESNVTTGRRKKIDCFSVDGICNHCDTVFEAMGCHFHYCPCQEARLSLTDNEFMRGIKKGTRPNAQRIYPTERIQNY